MILDQVDVVVFTQGVLDASEHLIGCVAMGNMFLNVEKKIELIF